jgi:ATP-binding cassette subfamily B protein RaxB
MRVTTFPRVSNATIAPRVVPAPLPATVDKFIRFRMLSLRAERQADLVLETGEMEIKPIAPSGQVRSCIELVDVSFRYADGEPWALRHVNLRIEPGESLAISGPPGCGKTTLLKLLLGALLPSEGEIRYAGKPVRQLDHRAYRQGVAAVLQDDQLLAGSFAENISYFDPQPDQTRIESCAQLAAIHDLIAAMPMGYQTLAVDMKTTLSSGQKQSLLLARALYKAPKVLVLDDATSYLDIEREHLFNEAIRVLKVTRIGVAHRPQTIAMAERVVCLNKGVVEQDYRQAGARGIAHKGLLRAYLAAN